MTNLERLRLISAEKLGEMVEHSDLHFCDMCPAGGYCEKVFHEQYEKELNTVGLKVPPPDCKKIFTDWLNQEELLN